MKNSQVNHGAEEWSKPADQPSRRWTSLTHPVVENSSPSIMYPQNKLHTLLRPWKLKITTEREGIQSKTYLSMWAALNTTSNSPLSRRAAFFAISAASSSRDSSNKN